MMLPAITGEVPESLEALVRKDVVAPPGPLTLETLAGWETIFGLPIGTITGNSIGLAKYAASIYCADVKAQDIASARLELWRRDGRGGQILVTPREHWLAELLARGPCENGEYTWTELVNMIVHHFDLLQEAFLVKRIRRDGRTLELIPIFPPHVQPLVNSRTRSRYYELSIISDFDQMMFAGIPFRIPAEQMVYIRGRMIHTNRPTSNLELARGTYELIAAVKDYQTALFKRDAQHSLSFQMDGTFGAGAESEAAFARLKRQLTERVGKMAKTGEPLLLEGGLKANILSMKAEDTGAEKALLQAYYEICRLHRVPPGKVGLPMVGTYENKQAVEEDYPKTALIPLCKTIERRLEYDLLTDDDRYDGLFLEFNREEIYLSSMSTVDRRVEVGMKTGTMKIEEARNLLRLNPLDGEGGDGRTVPSNMQVIGDDNNVMVAASSGSAQGGDQGGGNKPAAGTGD